MNDKHTPGPWVVGQWKQDNLSRIEQFIESLRQNEESRPYLAVFIQGESQDKDLNIAACGYGPTSMANAQLIAAAPDLLEALEGFVNEMATCSCGGVKGGETWCMNCYFKEELDTARKAIAKARGGE